MAATTLPNNGIQYAWTAGEDGWNTGMDANLKRIDTLMQCSVKDYTLSSPPVSPTSGDRYIVAAGASGAWSGQSTKLAVYLDAGWTFYTPQNGWLVKDVNSGRLIGYNGSAWVLDPLGDRAYADSVITGLWNDRGNFNASGGSYPSSGGSGTAGAIKKGDIWTISVAGTLPTAQTVEVGDTVRALIDTPGNTQANWAIGQNNIGYVAENAANKDSSTSLGTSNTLYPTQGAVKSYVDSLVSSNTTNISTTIEGIYHFVNRTTPFGDGPYITPASNSTNFYQTDFAAISGYEKAIGAVALYSNTSSTTYSASLIRRPDLLNLNLSDTVWTTGATFQTIMFASLYGNVPTAGNNFEQRFGFFYNGYYSAATTGGHASYAADPFASIDSTSSNDRSAAYFFTDNTSTYWQCKSGSDATTETTVTAVTAAVDIFRALRIKINTDGSVQFWIDGTLVATHNTGVITSGKCLSEAVTVVHTGALAAGGVKRGWVISSIGKKFTTPSTRTGFAFV